MVADPAFIDPSTLSPRRNIVEVAKQVVKSCGKAITIATEIAVVAFIGSIVGSYVSAKTIVGDCDKFNTSKVGDQYIQCTVVQPKKDTAAQPPR